MDSPGTTGSGAHATGFDGLLIRMTSGDRDEKVPALH
jgi:hypothetical protein